MIDDKLTFEPITPISQEFRSFSPSSSIYPSIASLNQHENENEQIHNEDQLQVQNNESIEEPIENDDNKNDSGINHPPINELNHSTTNHSNSSYSQYEYYNIFKNSLDLFQFFQNSKNSNHEYLNSKINQYNPYRDFLIFKIQIDEFIDCIKYLNKQNKLLKQDQSFEYRETINGVPFKSKDDINNTTVGSSYISNSHCKFMEQYKCYKYYKNYFELSTDSFNCKSNHIQNESKQDQNLNSFKNFIDFYLFFKEFKNSNYNYLRSKILNFNKDQDFIITRVQIEEFIEFTEYIFEFSEKAKRNQLLNQYNDYNNQSLSQVTDKNSISGSSDSSYGIEEVELSDNDLSLKVYPSQKID
ncbi:uncharacterized protein KGF55_001359 [Candida pseudojiufengensis]|uniref:uncharacterized protein n=1 Tax=Candida pseudojiufengensis TaxID=497109 RepID=UPI002224F11E|nr:uncharacterized protein KGF55_001359 [Candida pseudojiufengensis]KAI5965139.1 hypothetical protein KGF55_001359 [Candida pseudojiufengensis]